MKINQSINNFSYFFSNFSFYIATIFMVNKDYQFCLNIKAHKISNIIGYHVSNWT